MCITFICRWEKRYTESGTNGKSASPHPGIGREVRLRAEARRKKGLDRLFARPGEVLTHPHEAFALLVGGGGGGGVTRAEFCQVCRCCWCCWCWCGCVVAVVVVVAGFAEVVLLAQRARLVVVISRFLAPSASLVDRVKPTVSCGPEKKTSAPQKSEYRTRSVLKWSGLPANERTPWLSYEVHFWTWCLLPSVFAVCPSACRSFFSS